MRINISLCGENLIDWKVDCDDYLPDEMQRAISDPDLSFGAERICVLPKNEYKHYHGVGSWVESWADTIAVTK